MFTHIRACSRDMCTTFYGALHTLVRAHVIWIPSSRACHYTLALVHVIRLPTSFRSTCTTYTLWLSVALVQYVTYCNSWHGSSMSNSFHSALCRPCFELSSTWSSLFWIRRPCTLSVLDLILCSLQFFQFVFQFDSTEHLLCDLCVSEWLLS